MVSKVGNRWIKGSISRDIGEGRWRDHGQVAVYDYCEEDVHKSVELLRAQLNGRPGLPAADVGRVLHWSNYSAKAVALIQAKGMPIDMLLWNLVQENKAAVIGALLRQFDPSYGSDEPIYSPEGEWSYARFEHWLVSTGVPAWPRLDSGALDIYSDAFRLMYWYTGYRETCTRCATASASLFGRSFRLDATAATGRACSRSAPPPAATPMPEASTTLTPACAPSWFFQKT